MGCSGKANPADIKRELTYCYACETVKPAGENGICKECLENDLEGDMTPKVVEY